MLDYFYSLTPREFYNISTGAAEKDRDNTRFMMVQVRNVMWAALAPYQGKDFVPEKLVTFDWEKQGVLKTTDEIPAEALRQTIDEFARIDAKMGKTNNL